MAKKKIIILGAGLAGLSAAWHLKKRGIESAVFEREDAVGGLCRSKNINGFTFDYDGHLLHFKHRSTFNFIHDLLGNNLARHKRNAWVYSFDRHIPYPFQANLHALPSAIIKECLLGFIQASFGNHHRNKGNLQFFSWINKTFGKGIARHFMVPYNTKFWTVPPQQLTCEWLDGFIPVPLLKQVVEGAVEDSQEQFGYNAHFWYPKKGGINQLPLALAGRIKHTYTNCPATEINLAKKEITINSKAKEKFDFLVSTIPLPEIPYLIKDMPKEIRSLFRRLRWNSIFNLNLGIERKDDAGHHWVYFPEKNVSFFRVGFPHNFSAYNTPQGRSSLYIEVAYSKHKPIDKNKIVLSIKEDLEKTGLLGKKDRILCQDINDIEYGYPIYDSHYSAAVKGIRQYLIENNVFPCGRYGSWRYMSMEDVLLDGRRIAGIF